MARWTRTHPLAGCWEDLGRPRQSTARRGQRRRRGRWRGRVSLQVFAPHVTDVSLQTTRVCGLGAGVLQVIDR